jgi:hypothetical protein
MIQVGWLLWLTLGCILCQTIDKRAIGSLLLLIIALEQGVDQLTRMRGDYLASDFTPLLHTVKLLLGLFVSCLFFIILEATYNGQLVQ